MTRFYGAPYPQNDSRGRRHLTVEQAYRSHGQCIHERAEDINRSTFLSLTTGALQLNVFLDEFNRTMSSASSAYGRTSTNTRRLAGLSRHIQGGRRFFRVMLSAV